MPRGEWFVHSPDITQLRWRRLRPRLPSFLRFRARKEQWRPRDPTEPPADWVGPWWAERQRNPSSPAYAPQRAEFRQRTGDEEFVAHVLTNTNSRTWSTIGVPEGYERAQVDPRGLVVSGGWSLDWWVRAGQEWVFPSRAATVRQRVVDNMPVVETLLRVGGGEVVHRAAAARGAADEPWAAEALLVEISNQTGGPIAVALAARPFELSSYSQRRTSSEEWENGGAIDWIACDGRRWSLQAGWQRHVVFDRDPGDVVATTSGTDCAALLIATSDVEAESSTAVFIHSSDAGTSDATTAHPEGGPASIACDDRLATAAAVFPLVSGSTLRAAITPRSWVHLGEVQRSGPPAADYVDRLPSLERVASGWRRHLQAGCRLDLPTSRLRDVFEASAASLLLSTWLAGDGQGATGQMLWHPAFIVDQEDGDDLIQLHGLIETGAPDAVRDLLVRQALVQDAAGWTSSLGRVVTGTSLVLAEHLLALHDDQELAEAFGEFAASAVRWLLSRDAVREEPWTRREGLRAGYRMLRRLGADRAADELRRAAQELDGACALDVAAPSTAPGFFLNRSGDVPWSLPVDVADKSSMDSRWNWEMRDGGMWVHAAVPWAPVPPYIADAGPDDTPEGLVADIDGTRGHDLMATALLALAEAREAPARAFGRLEALVSVASPTLNWPTFMDPGLRTGTDGAGHDLRVGGLFVRTLLRLLVDVPDDGTPHEAQTTGLRLAAHWPAAWLGQPVEVHDVPTRIGKVSWAVRWHGERPALLWEVVPHRPDGAEPMVTAPGLDPSFAATGWRGETLLESMPAPSG